MKKHILLFIILIVLFPSIVLAEGKEDLKVSTYIENLNDSSLKRDNTSDNNLRYTGSDPNNYVSLGSYKKTYYQSYVHGDWLSFVNRFDEEYEQVDMTKDQCDVLHDNFVRDFVIPIDGDYYVECRKKDNSDYYYLYFELPAYLFLAYDAPLFADLNTCEAYNDRIFNYLWFLMFRLNEYPMCKKITNTIDEKWRIVGVFNNVDNGDGTYSKRVKLVRDESINLFYPGMYFVDYEEDAGNLETSITAYYKKIEEYLNNTYIVGDKFELSDIDVYNHIRDQRVITFNENMLDFIDKAKWNLTMVSIIDGVPTTYNLSEIYDLEKNSPYSYTNYIGLLSTQDVLYANDGGETYTNNESVSSYILYNKYARFLYLIPHTDSDYLFFKQLTMEEPMLNYSTSSVHFNDSLQNDYIRTVYCSTRACYSSNLNGDKVKPEVYLKEEIYVVDGTGTYDDPYILASDIINESVSISEQEDYLLEQLEEHPEITYQIEDPEIVKIVDGKIIPLKVGKTTITYQIGTTVYVYEIEVTEADLVPDNPATGREFNYCLVVLFVFVAYLFIRIRNKKYI